VNDRTRRFDHKVESEGAFMSPALRHYASGDNLITFDSLSEAACAILMEKHIPGWRVILGATYQVPIGAGRRCDFRLPDGTFLEWHPIDLNHEWKCRENYHDLSRLLRKTPAWLRENLTRILLQEKKAEYQRLRFLLIKTHYDNEDTELIVASNPSEFYRSVIRRYSPNPPPLKEFLAEFQGLC